MKRKAAFNVLIIILIVVFVLSIVALFFGDFLAATFDVIGIRIAVLIVAFASFGSSALFSLLVYIHNKTVSQINDDSNRRAELFRELQFASSNYSIIEFNDRMLIYKESERYIERLNKGRKPSFHMFHESIDLNKELLYYTIRIPFKVLEGKTPGSLKLSSINIEKENEKFKFIPIDGAMEELAYMLYNEKTKRNNLIMNIVFNKDSNFFNEDEVNLFTKIKININITSILGVIIKGSVELYFTNPTQIEGDGLNTYKINSSNFRLIQKPIIEKLEYHDIEI